MPPPLSSVMPMTWQSAWNGSFHRFMLKESLRVCLLTWAISVDPLVAHELIFFPMLRELLLFSWLLFYTLPSSSPSSSPSSTPAKKKAWSTGEGSGSEGSVKGASCLPPISVFDSLLVIACMSYGLHLVVDTIVPWWLA
jgi:hypothetical protein